MSMWVKFLVLLASSLPKNLIPFSLFFASTKNLLITYSKSTHDKLKKKFAWGCFYLKIP